MDNKTRILIIDDESLIRRSLSDYLDECGYVTTTANDGAHGLTRARAEQFDIVLVDLRMPRVDGLEVIATLKEEQTDLPVVVISGTGVLNDAVEAMRRGAWDYITKPIHDMDEVAVVIERVLKSARLKAERDRYQIELERLNRSLETEVARQTEDLRTQNRELAALNRISYAISDPLDLDTMLHRAVNSAVAAFQADAGEIRLLNPANDRLVIAATQGLDETYQTVARAITLGQGIAGQVAQSGRPRAGRDFASDPWLAPLGEGDGFKSYLCVPLRIEDEIRGTLGIVTKTARDFEAREVELLATIGNQVGVAVARAQYATDLRRANEQLERVNAELRRLDTLREQFIQNVAHELRTPLGLVHGYIQMLAQENLHPEEQQMALDVAARRVRALVELVESITTLQDLDSEPLRIERVRPAELVHTALQMVAQRAMTAGVTLRDGCPPGLETFPGDFTRLAQALHQLLDNACKFSSEGAAVTVNGRSTPEAVFVSVTDEGIGIPSEEHSRIFERFYQVDGSARRRYGGTGLGLAIAKEIIEAHGGRLTMKSVLGQGSTFTIQLPRILDDAVVDSVPDRDHRLRP